MKKNVGNDTFKISFWGVRGSLPISHKNFMKFGGATPCIEICAGEKVLIIDAGSGIQQLGRKWSNLGRSVVVHLFLTHVHWDHIHGFPFFGTAYEQGNQVHIYGESKQGLDIKSQLEGMMKNPYWPVSLDIMSSDLIFHTIQTNESIDMHNGLFIHTMRGNHFDGTLLFRITYGGRSFCHVSDYEHGTEIDPNLIEFVRDADVLVYDAAYSDEEYYGWNGKAPKKGWGHSTWQEGCKLANMANVKQLLLFHHEINRTDQELEEIEQKARLHFANTYAARVGMEITL